MDMLHEIARWMHIGVGTLAFASLWTAAFTRKGGRPHRTAGSTYVWTMVIVLTTAAVLTATTLARGQWAGAVFLAYLLTITGTALWFGRRALNFKNDARGYTRGPFLIVGVLNVIAALGAIVVGVMWREYFIAGISAIGFLIGFGSIYMWFKPPTHPRFWLKEHIGGMAGAGIATHVAFGSIGLRQLFPDVDTSVVTVWPWLAPVIIGFVLAGLAEQRYVNRGAPVQRGTRDAA